jgi:hypothetical protein
VPIEAEPSAGRLNACRQNSKPRSTQRRNRKGEQFGIYRPIGRMVKTMRTFGRRLHELETNETTASSGSFEGRQSGWKQPVPPSPLPPQFPMRVQEDDDAPSPTLTTQKISDLMGGRHKLGESTLKWSPGALSIECVQQLAQWDEGDSLPAKDGYV